MGFYDEQWRRFDEEERRDNIIDRRVIIGSIIFGLIVGGVYTMLWTRENRVCNRWANLYNKVVIVADTNKDGIISRDEWIKVYQELGIHVDELNPPNPKSLSTSQLEKYLSNHK
jgi:hypothetical protein